MKRSLVSGIVIVPETFRLYNESLEHMATRILIYADRAKRTTLLDTIRTGADKVAYSYTPEELYDDTVLYFTTNIQLSDGSWCGESPLTKINTRKEKFASTGIIATPTVNPDGDTLGGFMVYGSPFFRYDGVAEQESAEYKVVNELSGEVILYVTEDRENLSGILLPEDILEMNKVYRMMIRYKDVLGRWSNWGASIYNTSNFLYKIFPEDAHSVYIDDVLTVEKTDSSAYDMDDGLLLLSLSLRGGLISEQVYTGSFTFDPSPYVAGDVIDGVISYAGALVRSFKIYILGRDSGPVVTTTTTSTPAPTTTSTPAPTTTSTPAPTTTSTPPVTSAPAPNWTVSTLNFDPNFAHNNVVTTAKFIGSDGSSAWNIRGGTIYSYSSSWGLGSGATVMSDLTIPQASQNTAWVQQCGISRYSMTNGNYTLVSYYGKAKPVQNMTTTNLYASTSIVSSGGSTLLVSDLEVGVSDIYISKSGTSVTASWADSPGGTKHLRYTITATGTLTAH